MAPKPPKPPRPQGPPLGPRKMYELAEHYSEASRLLDGQPRGTEWGFFAPKILVDSFATELYLKCLLVLEGRTPPPSHDPEELFAALTGPTQDDIEGAFNQIISSHPVQQLIRLGLFNQAAQKTTDFRRSLKAAKNTFDKRRYLYEPQSTEEWFHADHLRNAIRAVADTRLQLAGL